MPFHIKELFLEIVKHYNFNDPNLCQHIPSIIRYNLISKVHYEWIKETVRDGHGTNKHSTKLQIKNALIWLNAQQLRKTINKNQMVSKTKIEYWADDYLTISSVEQAVLLYNHLNDYKIIGEYPYYNIKYKFTFPIEGKISRHEVFNGMKDEYKDFPVSTKIVYVKDIDKILNADTCLKLSLKQLQLLKDNPYLFKWINDDRPAKSGSLTPTLKKGQIIITSNHKILQLKKN